MGFEIPCDRCGTTGEVFENLSPNPDYPSYQLITCSRCNGKGYTTTMIDPFEKYKVEEDRYDH